MIRFRKMFHSKEGTNGTETLYTAQNKQVYIQTVFSNRKEALTLNNFIDRDLFIKEKLRIFRKNNLPHWTCQLKSIIS